MENHGCDVPTSGGRSEPREFPSHFLLSAADTAMHYDNRMSNHLELRHMWRAYRRASDTLCFMPSHLDAIPHKVVPTCDNRQGVKNLR